MTKMDCAHDPKDCRISVTYRTIQPYIPNPVYDGNGLIVAGNPDKTMMHYTCASCGMEWDKIFEPSDSDDVLFLVRAELWRRVRFRVQGRIRRISKWIGFMQWKARGN
jgi:hypothetical protein